MDAPASDNRLGLDVEVVLVGCSAFAQLVGVESGVGEAVTGATATTVPGIPVEEPTHLLLDRSIGLAPERTVAMGSATNAENCTSTMRSEGITPRLRASIPRSSPRRMSSA